MVTPNAVPSVNCSRLKSRAKEDEHLAREHKLTKLPGAYVYVPRDYEHSEAETREAKARQSNAERQKRCREKRREAGLETVSIPSEFAKAVRNSGGFEQWLVSHMKEHAVEKQVEGPATLTHRELHWMAIGQRVEALTGLRRWIVHMALD